MVRVFLADSQCTLPHLCSLCCYQEVMGDKWQIFLVEDKEEKPTAVLLPSDAREGVLSPVTEIWLCVVFGLLSIGSSLQAAGIPLFQFLINPFYTEVTQQVRVARCSGACRGPDKGTAATNLRQLHSSHRCHTS
eukprot:GHUV01047695.1.p1 GENE.GHUV01047695.1~~GHUV01047695.1.p1  ORF type:complete len:134 (-),score=28.49 GHUV01047695.1:410-811(-)